jgi:hypothetical protein
MWLFLETVFGPEMDTRGDKKKSIKKKKKKKTGKFKYKLKKKEITRWPKNSGSTVYCSVEMSPLRT